MIPYIIPLDSVPNQSLTVKLGGNAYVLFIYTKKSNLYIDVQVNGEYLLRGRSLVIDTLMEGSLTLVNVKDSSDPTYQELGTNFQLIYWAEDEQEEN